MDQVRAGGAPVGGATFINPYTFIPFPKVEPAGWRRAPAGHDGLGEGRYAGQVRVTLTARSPLLLRGVYAGEREVFPRRRFADGAEDVPYIPGSSLAGAVRSLHESLNGGCLRVFDGEFLPGYRDFAAAKDARWRLARVVRVAEDGSPKQVELCGSEPVWVPSELLAQALGGSEQLVTGAEVAIDERAVVRKSYGRSRGKEVSRREVGEAGAVKAGTGWTVLVGAWGARHKRDDRGDRGGHFCAVGKLTGQVSEVELAEGAWQRFLGAVDNTDDMRRARAKDTDHEEKPDLVPVRVLYKRGLDDGPLIGRRYAARRRVFAGQVLWVRAERRDGQKTVVLAELALAAIWRHGGEHAAAERVPAHLAAPCSDPEALCPTCRVFGAADTGGAEDGAARQRAYRGHLRFSDAAPVQGPEGGSVEVRSCQLPPLGAPKPGAGQFYLAHDHRRNGALPGKSFATPLREWGSEYDSGEGQARRLRGRKHYWLTGEPGKRPYFRAAEVDGAVFHSLNSAAGQANEMLSTAEAVAEGARFAFTVRFENLDLAELGGLLCTLDPALLLAGGDAKEEYGWAVGGGRPLGFGTCAPQVELTQAWSAAGRYGVRDQGGTVDLAAAVRAFRSAAPKELKEVWKAAAHVLRRDFADPHQVWFPPAGEIAGPGRRLDPAALMANFTFWNDTRGFLAEKADYPLLILPSAAASAEQQRLPLGSTDRDQLREGADRLRRASNARRADDSSSQAAPGEPDGEGGGR